MSEAKSTSGLLPGRTGQPVISTVSRRETLDERMRVERSLSRAGRRGAVVHSRFSLLRPIGSRSSAGAASRSRKTRQSRAVRADGPTARALLIGWQEVSVEKRVMVRATLVACFTFAAALVGCADSEDPEPTGTDDSAYRTVFSECTTGTCSGDQRCKHEVISYGPRGPVTKYYGTCVSASSCGPRDVCD